MHRRDFLYLVGANSVAAAVAGNALAKVGFAKVYNIVDGFEGDKIEDPKSVHHGKRMKNGWRNADLPWTYKLARNLMYLPVKK